METIILDRYSLSNFVCVLGHEGIDWYDLLKDRDWEVWAWATRDCPVPLENLIE